jgi:hypothetical protein
MNAVAAGSLCWCVGILRDVERTRHTKRHTNSLGRKQPPDKWQPKRKYPSASRWPAIFVFICLRCWESHKKPSNNQIYLSTT